MKRKVSLLAYDLYILKNPIVKGSFLNLNRSVKIQR